MHHRRHRRRNKRRINCIACSIGTYRPEQPDWCTHPDVTERQKHITLMQAGRNVFGSHTYNPHRDSYTLRIA